MRNYFPNLGRAGYLTWGMGLFLGKYLLDRSVATYVFSRPWLPGDYLRPSHYYDLWSVPKDEYSFYATLTALSVPFMICGLWLTIRRLRDAGLPPWFCPLFFVPLLNLLFFAILCVMKARGKAPGDSILFDSLPPDAFPAGEPEPMAGKTAPPPSGRFITAVRAIGITAALGLLLAFFGASVLKTYGVGLFLGVPFCLGLFSTLLMTQDEPRGFGQCLAAGMATLAVVGVGLLALSLEGLYCLLMAAPVAMVLAWAGVAMGYAIRLAEDYQYAQSHGSFFGVGLLMLPAIMAYEHGLNSNLPLLEVKSSVCIRAKPDVVWKQVIAFPEIPAPTDWLFRTGIAYPIRAEIDGAGPGAIRRCVFSTGAFVEPITVWDEPRLLKFSVEAQPPPMVEWSFREHVHAAHLNGYLQSHQGQFLLTDAPGGETRLEGTTWYTNRMWPQWYWRLWSDFIIHRIHLRVLDHIKAEAEMVTVK
ncbi:MAG: hypothetical protein K1X53_02075 [Candidatus Sumerlaeaceae bacterium]|nr:hypothetical protein [Candidatus Sumerlaeaceae bacterium]